MEVLYRLTEEQEMMRTNVKRIAQERVAPRAAEIDRSGEFPWDMLELLRENQILQIPIPEKYGGAGAGELTCCVVIEEFAKVCANTAHILADHWLGTTPIILGGGEELKQKYLPKMVTKLTAFSLTEPQAGTDAAALQTKAVLKGNEYIVNGTKCFCTDGHVADFVTLFVKTDAEAGARGISALVVEKGSPGFSVGKIEDQMGLRGTRACELVFEDCHVPKENLLGKEGSGFGTAMKTLDRGRATDASLAIGIAQGALDYAIEYAKQRVQFGRPIAEFQGLQFMMADMAAETEAARQLVYKAASLIDQETPNVRFSAMANFFASDTAVKVTNNAMQILGGYGYMRDYPLEQKMRDARLFQIVEGTNQILRVVTARALLG